MGKTILTPDQKKALRYIASADGMQSFYLSGGTALAEYYFLHRLSEDLDFFSEEKPDPLVLARIVSELKELLDAKKVISQKIFDRNLYFFDLNDTTLKMEFTYYPFKHLESVKNIKDIQVDSFRDLAANKCMALIDRTDPKDFVDMYYILQKRSLGRITKDVEKKFGIELAPMRLGAEFAKIRAIKALPRMKTKITLEELTDFYTKIAKKLSNSMFEA